MKVYENPAFLELISAHLKGREGVFLEVGGTRSIRGLKVENSYHLRRNFLGFGFKRHNYNIYQSLAVLENQPLLSLHPPTRKEQYQSFNQNFEGMIKGFDFPLDIDVKDPSDLKYALYDLRKVYNFFKFNEILFQTRCSGSGFHIIVPDQFLPNLNLSHDDKMELFGHIAEYLETFLGLDYLDRSIYDIRRIWKTPFTYDHKSGNLCLPLTEHEVFNFDYSMVKPDKFLDLRLPALMSELQKRNQLYNQGCPEGFTRFMEEYIECPSETVAQK